MSRLIIHRSLRFAQLAKQTGLSPGNLASHLGRLERAQYVQQGLAERSVERHKTIQITAQGDAAFRAYIAALKVLLAEHALGKDVQ